jgi:hypothetical protein
MAGCPLPTGLPKAYSAVDDPILEPDFWRYLSKGGRSFEEVEEFGAEEFGKGFDWQEEIIVRG